MSTMLQYKGYVGSVEFSEADDLLYGKLLFIRDLVSYEGIDGKGLKRAFHEAVDDYLATCDTEGRSPERPCKGSFNVRPGPELHRQAMLYAAQQGTNLNTVVSDALRAYLGRQAPAA